jgi:acetylornithine deacetylase/succinyl-diaminopimelate desuccinylase-like protein
MGSSEIRVENFRSDILQGNALGDPVERAVYVYLPPDYAGSGERYPVVFLLAGFAGSGASFLDFEAWDENLHQRMDRLIAAGRIRPMLAILPDATTRFGGSQYINSTATGRYQDYLLELVDWADHSFRTLPQREARAIVGKSSGGFGALSMGMDHPEVFGLVGDHSGDKYFEYCYRPEMPRFYRAVERQADLERLLSNPRHTRPHDQAFRDVMELAALSACYSPDPRSARNFEFPLDLETGALRPEIWEQWRRHDPLERLDEHEAALRSLRLIYLDAGRLDEFFLNVGMHLFHRRLDGSPSGTSMRRSTAVTSAPITASTTRLKRSAAPFPNKELDMPSTDAAIDYARKNNERALEDLRALIRIPSVSMTPEHKADVQLGAEWVASRLKDLGVDDVEILPTAGLPVVYGRWTGAGQAAPTLLVYGHYDVQPVDPLELWKSKPFEAEIRGENIYGRGASDMKGQLIAFLAALEAVSKAGSSAVNLKFLIEGEEELGSPSLEAFLKQNKDRYVCDACLNIDGSILGPEEPEVVYGVRGLAYFEIHVQAADHDLHSGLFGGAVENPAIALSKAIAGMRDASGRVTLPNFYDDVRPLTQAERQEFARLPHDEKWWLEQTGAPALYGETGYTINERVLARPTIDVNGFFSGFIGVGSKTVLPSRAMAKVSMRLVPDQTPPKIHRSLESYLKSAMPATVSWEVKELAHSLPAMAAQDSQVVQSAARALEAVWGKRPILGRTGGTIPIVAMIQDVLHSDSVIVGFGLPDDNLHSPNESCTCQRSGAHRGFRPAADRIRRVTPTGAPGRPTSNLLWGQAVIEGVMMRGHGMRHRRAAPDGTVRFDIRTIDSIARRRVGAAWCAVCLCDRHAQPRISLAVLLRRVRPDPRERRRRPIAATMVGLSWPASLSSSCSRPQSLLAWSVFWASPRRSASRRRTHAAGPLAGYLWAIGESPRSARYAYHGRSTRPHTPSRPSPLVVESGAFPCEHLDVERRSC